MVTILLVEDNAPMRQLISLTLKQSGYMVKETADGNAALDVMDHTSVSMIISDLLMPSMDGCDFIEAIRSANYVTPVLVMSAKDTLEDKRRVFSIGADDYMVKPFPMEELMLRVEALLRRSRITNSHVLSIGNTTLYEDSMASVCGDKVTILPQKEFFLLQTLLSYPGRIFTRQALMDEIWGYDNDSDPRTVDVHISRLRGKYSYTNDFAIETIRGLGYRAVAM